MFLLLAGPLCVAQAAATTAGFNPYSGIVERNSFGLKPPVNPADLVKPPPPQVADIKLQGITTILGRKQVLMKVRIPAKPPEPARDQSVVLSEGQREGEVEVLEINPAEGTVKINNAGSPLALNMKDNGEKPTPGAAPPPAVGGVPPPGLPTIPGVPPPAAPPAAALIPANTGGGVTTFGSTEVRSTATPTIPTRTMRTGAAAGVAGATALPGLATPQSTAQSSYQPPASNLSVDEQMAVLAVQHAAGDSTPGAAMLPPLPAKYQQKK